MNTDSINLDINETSRIDKLKADWNVDISVEDGGGTAAELRWLLQNFDPLRDLIKSILATSMEDQNDKLLEYKSKVEQLTLEIKQSKEEVAELKEKLNAAEAASSSEKMKAEEIVKTNEKISLEVDALKADLNAISYSDDLNFIRAESGILQAMGLDKLLENDAGDLVRVVAVLSQIENIKRLWDCLKNRCESDKRTASKQELNLLNSVLQWHNYNWSSYPYELLKANAGEAYNYEVQLRSAQVNKGELIKESLLPGISDGNGKLLRKVLVLTE